MPQNCTPFQKSLAWCMGIPELPGIRRRIYYISKDQIAQWPPFNRDDNYRAKTAVLTGNFTLVADAKWKYIDILPDKSQLTSEAQGELPCQTQLNKLVAVHPGVGTEASAAACYLNNSDNVFVSRRRQREVGHQDNCHARQWSRPHWYCCHHYQCGGYGRNTCSFLCRHPRYGGWYHQLYPV